MLAAGDATGFCELWHCKIAICLRYIFKFDAESDNFFTRPLRRIYPLFSFVFASHSELFGDMPQRNSFDGLVFCQLSFCFHDSIFSFPKIAVIQLFFPEGS